jgi:iron complex outermembrane receptor protein
MIAGRSKSGLIFIFSFFFILFRISILSAQQKPVADILTSESKTVLHQDTTLIRGTPHEVVGIGYGSLRKRELTTSVTTIYSDGFNKGNIENPLQLIQGKVAGLSISKFGGDPNGSYYVRLRGMTTINGITGPLVVIDGVPDASLDNVDPNDIEYIDVLKDASSAAIYGVRGSGGVILVTTKKVKKGKAVVEYNVCTSAEKVARDEPVMNAKEWRTMSAETGLGTDYGATTNWFREIDQTALSQVHNISMSGGSDKAGYRASVNYRTGNGVLINTGYNQFNGRINIKQKALNDKLTLDLNLGATERESQLGFAEAFRYAAIYNPTSPVKSDDPEFSIYGGYFQKLNFDYYNPVQIAQEDRNERKNRNLNLSLKGTYEITKGLNIDALYSVQSNGALGGKYFDTHDLWGGINPYIYNDNGLAYRQQDNATSRFFESSVHFNSDLTSSINLNLLGGYSYQDFTNEGFNAQGGGFLTDAFTFNNLAAALEFKNGKGIVTSYKNSNRLSAFFGRINLNINNLWFISACVRNEGSSRFGTSHKWGLFPAVGSGIDLSKIIRIPSLDNFKLRIDYGITGNQPAASYLSLEKFDYTYGTIYYNGKYGPVYGVTQNDNPVLKWERKGELDAGFDFSLFSSRLTGSFDIYSQSASDLLYYFSYQLPVPPNLSGAVWLNCGKIKSHGTELTLNYAVIRKSDLTYNISFCFSHNSGNTLVSLSGTYNGTDLNPGTQELGDMGSPGPGQQALLLVQEGKPVGQLYTFVFKEIDATGRQVFVDINKDGVVDNRDRVVTGSGLPKNLIGFGNRIVFKNWDLCFFFRCVTGHSLINSYRAFYETPSWIEAYNLPVTAIDKRNPTTGAFMNSYGGWVTNLDVENASFVSLDNMSLGYNFSLRNGSLFGKIRLYLGGNNLFYFTRYTGPDPNPRYADSELNLGTFNNPLVPGIDRRTEWPRTRTFTFGANFVF